MSIKFFLTNLGMTRFVLKEHLQRQMMAIHQTNGETVFSMSQSQLLHLFFAQKVLADFPHHFRCIDTSKTPSAHSPSTWTVNSEEIQITYRYIITANECLKMNKLN